MGPNDEAALIAKYERLRCWLLRLMTEADEVDRQLVEMEGRLPEHYVHPDDPPGEYPPDKPPEISD